MPQLRLTKFVPGLVTTRPSSLLGEGHAAVANNVDLAGGTIKRREGWSQIHAPALPSGTAEVTSLYSYYFAATKQLLATAGQYLIKSTGADFSTITTMLAPASPIYPTFETLNNGCYIASRYGADLTQVLNKWDGTALTTSSSPPGSLVTQFENALFVAGNTAAPSRLYWSGLVGTTGPDAWPAANFIDLAPGDGGIITGFSRTLNALVVFKERSLFRVVGQPPDNAATDAGTISVTEVEGVPGCRAPLTVDTNKNLIMYLGEDGLYLFDGVGSTEITADVRPFFQNVSAADYKNARGAWVSPTRYILTLKNAAGVYKTLVVSLDPFNIVTWSGTTPTAVGKFNFAGTVGEKPVLGTSAGIIGRLGASNSDNGTAIAWEYTTGVLPLQPSTFLKAIRNWAIRGKANSDQVTVTFRKDLTAGGIAKVVTFVPTSDEEDVLRRFFTSHKGRALELQLVGSGTGTPTEVNEITLDYVRLAH